MSRRVVGSNLFASLCVLFVLALPAYGAAPYFSPPAQLVAHRGGTDLWPENTLLAFANTSTQWPEAILEMDLDMTSDGYLVLMHDSTVDRTTDGTGLVSSMTLAEIQALDAAYDFTADGGTTFPYRGTGVRVPTLTGVLAATPASRLWIEIKGEAGVPAVAPTIAAIRAAGAEERVVVGAFAEPIVQEIRTLAPDILTNFSVPSGVALLTALRTGGAAWDSYVPPDDTIAIGTGQIVEFGITNDEILAIRDKGIPFYVWTVNDPAEMRELLEIPVDGIMTDRPDLLAQAIEDLSQPLPVSTTAGCLALAFAACAVFGASRLLRRR